MSGELVLREQQGNVGILILNRPEALNAINGALGHAVSAALDELEGDEAIRVIVLTGSGRAFCAGADLKAVGSGGLDIVTRPGGFAGLTHRDVSKPLIAAVNGLAFGGGFEIVLSCDLVVAEEGARFGLPEALVGLTAAAGGLERLPRRIPRAIAMEIALTGQPIDAARAHTLGLVNRLVPNGRAVEGALELAELVCKASPMAAGYAKAVIRSSVADGEADAVAQHADLFKTLMSSDDSREGVAAFIEKRPPVWTGR